MRIASIAYCLPEAILTNRQVVDLFLEGSRKHFSAEDLAEFERRIGLFLEMSGIASRRVARDREASLDLAIAAANKALAGAGIGAGDIDLVIYASVARGWLEPCMAVAVQKAIGARNATSFDVLDACAGWIRAMHMAHALLKAGVYRNILIVNLESGMLDFIRFEMNDLGDITRYGAAATLGNAATATLLCHSDDDDFYFNIKTFPERMDLCMMPLQNVANFLPQANGSLMPGKFVADSTPLIAATTRHLVDTYMSDEYLRAQKYDITFSHAVSARVNRLIAEATQVPLHLLYSTHRNYGNTASASVPLAMGLAIEENRLRRGQRVGVAIGSAGITVGLATFTF
jgi:3-oxoacyl-[acyl-carrier-protein] synthase III